MSLGNFDFAEDKVAFSSVAWLLSGLDAEYEAYN